MSGMTMSRKMMVGFSALAFSTASLPLGAVTTMQPASLRMDLRFAISDGESSTISAFLAIFWFLCWFGRFSSVSAIALCVKQGRLGNAPAFRAVAKIFFHHTAEGFAVDRLGEVGVAASKRTLDTVEGGGLAGEHDDRRAFGCLVFFDRSANLITIGAGEHYIEKNDVVAAECNLVQGNVTIFGHLDVDTKALQAEFKLFAHRGTIVDHQCQAVTWRNRPHVKRGLRRSVEDAR